MTKSIVHVVGARPNYMKIAPLMDALAGAPDVRQILVNTGQHYDEAMATGFIRDLKLPMPDRNLEVGSASHAVQTANVMIRFESVCLEERPDLIVVVGDVNSTMAAALVGAKLRIPVAHVEAGLRSFDRAMPEEINRIVTDRVSDLLLTPSRDADENLAREGVPPEKIFFVGNIMIDTLFRHLPATTFDRVRERVGAPEKEYAVLTLHRPSNVDDRETFRGILEAVSAVAKDMPVVFPVHPRTRQRIAEFGFTGAATALTLTEPLGYVDFLSLTSHAKLILTDSGGLQEESTALGIPCLTLRENTERPVTVTHGTNRVVGTSPADIVAGYRAAVNGVDRKTPELWDGRTAGRIRAVFETFLFG
ncbi:MAG TPA: UDP-N-acetylglucosamine 2-epimerase (non-hydrolyzing) [Vicinamibacterales bacterium]|nr:UDP-N-acetylglucosamine 2-epimerase (non-hydrolyzing) [Vicinamibacterales bacterium]